jgi:flagellar hook-associated protein 3 FlgL
VHLKTTLSSVRDLDYAEALSRLSQELFGLDAAQQAFARTQGLSLFKYI